MDAGAGEGVIGFAVAAGGFRAEAEVYDVEGVIGEVGVEVGVDVCDVGAVLGDGVAEEEDAGVGLEEVGVLCGVGRFSGGLSEKW